MEAPWPPKHLDGGVPQGVWNKHESATQVAQPREREESFVGSRIRKALKWTLIGVLLCLALFCAEALYVFRAPLAPAWRTVSPGQEDVVDFAHYPYSKTVNEHMNALCGKYPDLIRSQEIGRTHQGKPIFAYTLTDSRKGAASDKPGFFVIAQLHAREPIASQTALYFMTYLLENYGKDATVTALLDTRTAYVVPQANPDGNDIFLSEDESHRGNARPTDRDGDGQFNEDRPEAGLNHYQKSLYVFKPGWVQATKGRPFSAGANEKTWYVAKSLGWVDSANRPAPQRDKDGDGKAAEDPFHGVDLNRNWDFSWPRAEANPASDTYRGPEPFSEPESKAIAHFAASLPNVVSFLDLHSGSNSYLYPPAAGGGKPPEAPVHDAIGAALVKALSMRDLRFVSSQNVEPAGKSADWFYSRGVFAATLEVFGDSRTYVVRRLWPLPLFIRYASMSRSFNPAPEDMKEILLNRLTGVLYLFAAMPEAALSSAARSGGTPSFDLGAQILPP